MREKLRKRFCPHRGDTSAGPDNSLKAIKAGVRQHVFYVEFDLIWVDAALGVIQDADQVDGVWRSGHPFEPSDHPLRVPHELLRYPPSAPLVPLKHILPAFKNNKTIAKLDLKMPTAGNPRTALDAVLGDVQDADLECVLLNIGARSRESTMEAQRYLAERVQDKERIKLNIAPQCFRPYGKLMDKDIHQHVSSLGDFVYTLSPEINWEDHDAMGLFAQQHGIPYVCFWLEGPVVMEETLEKAIELKHKYGVGVFFDMDMKSVKEKGHAR